MRNRELNRKLVKEFYGLRREHLDDMNDVRLNEYAQHALDRAFPDEIENIFPPKAGMTSLAYHIPIELVSAVQAIYRNAGIKVHCRYRGPRAHRANRYSAQSFCLKQDANFFSVYKD